jgi:tetratricopeptide (TPR) repeat protein
MDRSGTGSISVRVRSVTGAPLTAPAMIRVSSRSGGVTFTATLQDHTPADFQGLPLGDYLVEVNAPGFLPATEEAQVQFAGSLSHVLIYLRPASLAEPAAPSGLAPVPKKARKAMHKAAKALEKDDLNQAFRHMADAEKAAPNHPEVHYHLGLLCLRRGDPITARVHFERAVALHPQDVPALTALGGLLFQQGEVEQGIVAIERALAVDGGSAGNHAVLARAFLQRKEFQKAAFHARQAVELSEGKRPEFRLLLSRIYAKQGDNEKTAQLLVAFLQDFPNHPDAGAVRDALATIRQQAHRAAAPSEGTGEESTSTTAMDSPPGAPAFDLPVKLAAIPPEDSLRDDWVPPDVDSARPAVFRDVPCDPGNLIRQAGRRVQELVNHLGRVNAEEIVEHTDFDRHGKPRQPEIRRYDYMVFIRRLQTDSLAVEEYRNGNYGAEAVAGFSTTGLVAMALVFHPQYAGDYQMTCEGQGVWNSQPVWFLYFKQRPDKPARMRRYTDSKGSNLIPLKGRAWIAANSFQIVRMETGMVAPVPAAQLEREHLVIEYKPVHFAKRNQTFWLPASAELYSHLRGRRWHRRHTLQNYVLFAVDTHQRISDPKPEERHPPFPPSESLHMERMLPGGKRRSGSAPQLEGRQPCCNGRYSRETLNPATP